MRTSHLTARAGALLALALFELSPGRATAQDTIAVHRHVLALDLTRVRPFARSYDMVVHVGDSAHVIGQRDVTFSESAYAGQPAWLLVETRTGLVPAQDSLYLAADMRPVHWSSELGKSRLSVEFSGDSAFGVTATPAARHNLILGSRPDLLVSTAMVEALVPLLPLAAGWSDSAAVLAVDAGDASVIPAELAIVGEEPAAVVGDTLSGAWLLAVRTERGEFQLWVERSTGQVSRIEQSLPAHVGSRLEFRPRTSQASGTPLPP